MLFQSVAAEVIKDQTEEELPNLAEGSQPNRLHAPRDYAYSLLGSRVKDLVNFFETLDSSRASTLSSQKLNVTLTLAESASKLCLLTDGMPLDVKCNKYISLIRKPNIRSVQTISELMAEQRLFSDMIQTDANLLARLSNERQFDALGRLQTIVTTLESEASLGKSTLEPVVQKDLLDCMNYYIYRHQRATTDVVTYARQSMVALSPKIVEPSSTEILARKFRDRMEEIRKIESNAEGKYLDYRHWLKAMDGLRDLVEQQEYQIPEVVVEFLQNPQRSAIFNSMMEKSQEPLSLMRNISAMEKDGSSQSDRETYQSLLTALKEKLDNFGEILHPKVQEFIEEDERARVLSGLQSPSDLPKSGGKEEDDHSEAEQLERIQSEVELPVDEVFETESPGDSFPKEEYPKYKEPEAQSPEDGRQESNFEEDELFHEDSLMKFEAQPTSSGGDVISFGGDQHGWIDQACADFIYTLESTSLGVPLSSEEGEILNDSIIDILDIFNTECLYHNQQLWNKNNLLLEMNKNTDHLAYSYPIIDTINGLCDGAINDGASEAAHSKIDCVRVQDIFLWLREGSQSSNTVAGRKNTSIGGR